MTAVSRLDRRGFLTRSALVAGAGVGLGSLGSFLTACGSSGGGDDASSPGWALVQRWPTTSLVPGPVRLPVSLADDSSILATGPLELTGRIRRSEDGAVVADGLIATRHGDDLGLAYWPFLAQIEEPGIYLLDVEGGRPDGAALQILDAAQVAVPGPGAELPPFDTPTFENSRGVDPICTRLPEPCPLHEVTLTEALATGRPVAYLVGTPAYCQTGTCAPALDALLAVREEIGDAVTMIHAEVYTDSTATEVAPAVRACGLDFEPSLFLVGADGRVRERLDAVFDTTEIRAGLQRLVS